MIEEYDLSIKPRDYQINAYKFAIEHERGLILSPTASNKSLIIYMLVRHYLNMINNNILDYCTNNITSRTIIQRF